MFEFGNLILGWYLTPNTYNIYLNNSLINRLLMLNGSWLMAQGSRLVPQGMSLEP